MKLEGKNLDEYEGLLVSIEANSRKLNLLIGVCNDSQYRDELIREYEAEVEEGIVCYSITLRREKPSIRFLLEDLIKQNPGIAEQDRVVVTVLGADKLRFLELEEGKKSEVEEFAGYMQWTREGLRRFPFSIVIWVTTNVETVLKQKAVDFWSWRKGVFRFETKPREFVRKADLEPVREFFGKNFQAKYTSLISLITIDDLKELIVSMEQKDPEDHLLQSLYDALGRKYAENIEKYDSNASRQEAQKAIDCFHKALNFSKDETNARAYLFTKLGYINSQLGNYSEAEKFYKHAFKINIVSSMARPTQRVRIKKSSVKTVQEFIDRYKITHHLESEEEVSHRLLVSLSTLNRFKNPDIGVAESSMRFIVENLGLPYEEIIDNNPIEIDNIVDKTQSTIVILLGGYIKQNQEDIEKFNSWREHFEDQIHFSSTPLITEGSNNYVAISAEIEEQDFDKAMMYLEIMQEFLVENKITFKISQQPEESQRFVR